MSGQLSDVSSSQTEPVPVTSDSGSETGFPFSGPPAVTGPDTVVVQPAGVDTPQDVAALQPETALERLFGGKSGNGETADPRGIVLGHFEIESLIGAGGMGAVFRATDLSLRRTVAVKVLSPKLSRDPAFTRRFLNEARSCARLNHENVARIFFIGEDKGVHFIVFEYVDGTNLRDLIQFHGKLKSGDAINYTLQIAIALTQTAAASVIHRDIKPSNIIITRSGRAKLVDLGLARKEGDDSSADITVAGTTLGTFDYISPEQAKDPRSVDVRSDIYSLGCSMYHMLTGQPPYPEGTALQKLLDHQGKDPPDPRSLNPRVTTELAEICQRMMASHPVDRYESPEALTHELMLLARRVRLAWYESGRPCLDDAAPKSQRIRSEVRWAGWP